MAKSLQGKRVAMLVENGFEQVELTEPRKALVDAGAEADIVSPVSGSVRAWNLKEWGEEMPVDTPLEKADPQAYDALVLPGGVMNPDKLRMNADALEFVKAFFVSSKPVAVICHGPWTLIDAGVVANRKITSYPSLAADLRNAGAEWVDSEVVVDNGLVSSRSPKDLPAFMSKMVEEFAEGRHERRAKGKGGAGLPL
jgi:protease I